MLKLIPFVVMLSFTNCGSCNQSLTSPSSVTGTQVLGVWSPYIGIHPYGGGENQKPYLEKLIQAGVLKGMRVENLDSPDVQQFAGWLDSKHVEVLGLIDQKEYLRDPNFNRIFSEHVRQNPTVRVWEIGNEVQNLNGGAMSPQEYMRIFSNLHDYVRANNINVRLATQSDGLKEMLDNGLKDIVGNDPRVVITVHFYEYKQTISLEDLGKQIARLPAITEVWITETGDGMWSRQQSYVANNYPRYQAALRARRIFWHVFSKCPGTDGDNSLVAGLPDQCATNPPTESPLYQTLVGGAL